MWHFASQRHPCLDVRARADKTASQMQLPDLNTDVTGCAPFRGGPVFCRRAVWGCLGAGLFVADAALLSCLQGSEGHYVLEFNNYTEGGKVGKPDKLEVSRRSSSSSGQARDAA